jgi:ATP-binding cassette subfamily B protein
LLLTELFRHTSGKTVVFVTHRISSATNADQVCLLKNGRVGAIGTHSTLLAESSDYGELLRAAGAPEQRRDWRIQNA